jgi:hypothetical protein
LFLSVGVEIVPAKKFTAAVFLHTFSTVGKSMSHRAAGARWKRTSVTPKFLSLTNLFSIHFTPKDQMLLFARSFTSKTVNHI